MAKQVPSYVPILLLVIWVAAWGAAYRYLKRTSFGPTYSDLQIAVWGGLGFLVGYYAFHKDESKLLDPVAPPQPAKDPSGYWRIPLDEFYDLCFAREGEGQCLPDSDWHGGIGRIECLVADTSKLSVDERARVWVWLEWLVIGSKARSGVPDLS